MSGIKSLAALLFLLPVCAIPGRGEDLKLLISVQQQNITAPNPVRATLHFHNSGQQTMWLYSPVRSELPAIQSYALPASIGGQNSEPTYIGSTLKVQLEPIASAGSGKAQEEGRGFALSPDGLPFPRLIRLAPGDDYSERVTIHVAPAQTQSDGNHAGWGQYRFSVIYSAHYPNAEILARDIHANLWQGQVSSNSVTLNLQPSTAHGSIAGTVAGPVGRPLTGALVTLSDNNENDLDQVYSDVDGRFSFTDLPSGRYWLTVREPGSDHDTSVFRDVDVNPAGSPAKAAIMLLPVEADKPDRILHKPVLFHVVDTKGHPLAKVKLAILKTTDEIIQNVKVVTGQDGFVATDLIPGLNLVTLQMHGCKRKEDRQADVARGPGVDGFEYVYECAK